MNRYCTQLDSLHAIPALALIESIYEHEDSETEIFVLCEDQASVAMLGKIPMPQLRPLNKAVLGEPHSTSPAQIAAQLLLHIHREQPTPSPVIYLDPTAYLVRSLDDLVAQTETVGWVPSQADPLSRPCAIVSSGDDAALSTLSTCAQGAALHSQSGLQTIAPSADLGTPADELPLWFIDGSMVTRLSQEIVFLQANVKRPLSTIAISLHAMPYVDALSRAATWLLSRDPNCSVAQSLDGLSMAETFIAARGLRKTLLQRPLTQKLVSLSPVWDLYACPQLEKELKSASSLPSPSPRRPPVSRLQVKHSQDMTDASRIRVSALVSSYKAERYIQGCLQDLVEQTLFQRGELEIVVVDSASPENEAATVVDYMARYPNIVYLRSPQREGVYMAWNRAASIARGRYLSNANTDDRHRADSLELLADVLDTHPNVGLVYADSWATKDENAHIDTATMTARFAWPKYSRDALLHGCFIGPQPMWRRCLHDELGYFDSRYRIAGDFEMWLRFTQHHDALHVSDTLGLYLNTTSGIESSDRALCVAETLALCGLYARRVDRSLAAGRYPTSYVVAP